MLVFTGIVVAETTFREKNDFLLTPELVSKLSKGEYVVLLRHALAPGTGDPANFDINHCETQRNLSELGRKQAAYIGQRLKSSGINNAQVYTSQWCRCRETARLLDFGEATDLPVINSFFQNFSLEEQQTQDLTHWLIKTTTEKKHPVILVTHQVNITALTGVFPESGELIVIEIDKQNSIRVMSRIRTDV